MTTIVTIRPRPTRILTLVPWSLPHPHRSGFYRHGSVWATTSRDVVQACFIEARDLSTGRGLDPPYSAAEHAFMAHDHPPAWPIAPLVSDIRAVLGNELVGLYLYGSAVSGDFDEDVSDIDLVAVTRPDVSAIEIAALERMHVD